MAPSPFNMPVNRLPFLTDPGVDLTCPEADSPAPVADLGVWQDNVCLKCSVQPPEEERNGLTSPDSYKENKRPECPEIEIS